MPRLRASAVGGPAGKLRAAALVFLAEPQGETERRLGLDPGDLDGTEQVMVWPDTWPAVRCFAALQTQWVLAPDGRPIGLRYAALIDALWRALGIRRRRRPAIFRDLQVMERALLEEIEQRRSAAAR